MCVLCVCVCVCVCVCETHSHTHTRTHTLALCARTFVRRQMGSLPCCIPASDSTCVHALEVRVSVSGKASERFSLQASHAQTRIHAHTHRGKCIGAHLAIHVHGKRVIRSHGVGDGAHVLPRAPGPLHTDESEIRTHAHTHTHTHAHAHTRTPSEQPATDLQFNCTPSSLGNHPPPKRLELCTYSVRFNLSTVVDNLVLALPLARCLQRRPVCNVALLQRANLSQQRRGKEG